MPDDIVSLEDMLAIERVAQELWERRPDAVRLNGNP